MRECKQQTIPKTQSRSLKQSVEQQTERSDTQNTRLPQHDSFVRTIVRAGSTQSASTHAIMLSRAIAAQPSRTKQLLLQLQRHYGNSYVQRVVELSRKGDGETEAAPEIEAAIEQSRGNGQPLNSNVRVQMESAFGVDFSGVRVHTDTEADTLNKALTARAFTTGQDIFFRQGEYNPSSSNGRELLAHELTHVVQQTGEIRGKLVIGQPGDKYEQEADQVARTIIQSEQRTEHSEVNAGLVQRQMPKDENPLITKMGNAKAQHQIPKEDITSLVQTRLADGIVQRDNEDRAYEQPDIYYVVDDQQHADIPRTKTYWGTVPNAIDDSYVESLVTPYWLHPRMVNGVGRMGIVVPLVDWRDTVYLNDQFLPRLQAGIRWEQRQAHERLTISPGVVDYTPDGGGSMQVIVNYSYGGYREDNGRKRGYHNILFNFIYSSNTSRSSEAGLEIGGEYNGASATVSASSSVNVTDASLSFVREMAFHSV